jgi:hypothetical protein
VLVVSILTINIDEITLALAITPPNEFDYHIVCAMTLSGKMLNNIMD